MRSITATEEDGKMNERIEELGYICFGCARRLGGVWPEGHVATAHMGTCPECKQRKSLVSVDDYDWPKKSKRPKYGAGRD